MRIPVIYLALVATLAFPVAAGAAEPPPGFTTAVARGDVPLVRQILADNPDADFKGPAARRALLHAAGVGNAEMVQLLLDSGADAKTRSKDPVARTPLMLAAAGGHIEVVNILVSRGAKVDARDRSGKTALAWATLQGRLSAVDKRVFDLVIRFGTSESPKRTRSSTAISAPAALRPWRYATPLLRSVLAPHHYRKWLDAMLGWLLCFPYAASRLRVNSASSSLLGTTGHRFALHGRQRALVNKGANVNTADNGKVTPLLLAVGRADDATMRVLVSHGADLEAESAQNSMTPLLLAIERNGIGTAMLPP